MSGHEVVESRLAGWPGRLRRAECAVVFGLLPVPVLAGWVPMGWLLPGLCVLGAAAWWGTRRGDVGVGERQPEPSLCSGSAWVGCVVVQFVVLAPLMLGLVVAMRWAGDAGWLAVPEAVRPFGLVRSNAGLWGLIMVGYPLVSVLPQEVLFRAWFCRRYGPAFGSEWGLVAANALAFGWAHVIFENATAVVLTTVGGALFCVTYRRTGSLWAAWIEHALYGCWVFTCGLGWLFYGGSVG